MINDKLTLRMAHIVTGGKVSNKALSIGIVSSLPMLITKPEYIEELKVIETPSPNIVDEDFDITDIEYTKEKGEERYVLLTVAESPLSKNRAVFYYDKLFEDIIILPNLSFLDIVDINAHYEIRGFRLGSGGKISENRAHQVMAINENTVTKLPLTKNKISVKSKLVLVPGMTPEHMIRNDLIETMITNNDNLCRTTIQPSVLIELGTAADIFTKTGTNLPLYLLGQSTIREYTIQWLGNIDPKTHKIFISLTF